MSTGATQISFARGVPAPECLPVAALADSAKAALEHDGAAALLYGHTLGYEPLRAWIGERHGVDPERVVVTNGSLQVFHFVLSTFAEGRSVIVERPGPLYRVLAVDGKSNPLILRTPMLRAVAARIGLATDLIPVRTMVRAASSRAGSISLCCRDRRSTSWRQRTVRSCASPTGWVITVLRRSS